MSDPFETLGVEARFDLDDAALEQRHRTLSKTLHPDRYAGRPAAERRMALDKAIDVNAAWRALRDPVKRAETLLARLGVETGELAEPKAPPALLMEMMEVREELSEAHQNEDLDRIGKVADRMRSKERDVLARLRAGFAEANDAESAKQLVPLVGELRYVRRFFEELDAIEEQLME
jgi:molecular chaperone HscB